MSQSPAATPPVAMHLGDEVQASPFTVHWKKLMMWVFLCSDGMGFVGMLCAYAFMRSKSAMWPAADWFPEGSHIREHLTEVLANLDISAGQTLLPSNVLGIWVTAGTTFLLIVSSLTMVKAYSACLKGDQAGLSKWLLATIIGGAIFLGVQVYEWNHLIHAGMVPNGNNFAGTFFMITGFHGAHVFTGVTYLFIVWLRVQKGKYGPENSVGIEIVGLFWHFVDLVWIVVFTVIYLV